MRSRSFLSFLLLGLLPAAGWTQPTGQAFLVNSYTAGSQDHADVAMGPGGDFVVVWNSGTSPGEYGSGAGIFGRRFDASGTARGTEFRVDSDTLVPNGRPSVAVDPLGNFVVVWEALGPDGSHEGVFAQRFDAQSNPVGPEFQVNSYTTGDQQHPRVAADASGGFVVLWDSGSQDGDGPGVFAQRFAPDGTRAGGEFQVNSYTTGDQSFPAVAVTPAGGFVAVWFRCQWDDQRHLCDPGDVFARRFDASGAPQGPDFQVSSGTAYAENPSVGTDAAGNVVVVWDGDVGTTAFQIRGRRFDASGTPLGPDFQVSTPIAYPLGYLSCRLPRVSVDPGGAFVVAWERSQNIYGRVFDAAGAPAGDELSIDAGPSGWSTTPAVTSTREGDFMVAWESWGRHGGSELDVVARGFRDLLFRDGFEGGNLDGWSAASTDGGELRVSADAAMAGTSLGLEAVVNDTNRLFVQDDTPGGEDRYRARFYFDPHGFDPGEAEGHFRTRVFIAFDGFGRRVFMLALKRQGGAYAVQARVRNDNGRRSVTGFLPITNGPHFLEVNLVSGSAPATTDGVFTLWIDGVVASRLGFLRNHDRPVRFVRLGALSVKTGAAGTLWFDQFESRRYRPIGP